MSHRTLHPPFWRVRVAGRSAPYLRLCRARYRAGVNSAHVHVGRLLELRAIKGYRTAEDVDAMFVLIERAMTKVPPPLRTVNVVDWRLLPLMTGDASTRLFQLMAQYNPRVERSAILASRDAPTAVMQFLRVIGESKHPDRRLFHDADELESWLGELLSAEESARLRTFLTQSSSSPAAPRR